MAEDKSSDLAQKILQVRRVARVVRGGRRFSFSLAVAVGDHRGGVGFALGKGADVSSALDKASRLAKKYLITVPLTPSSSIPHQVKVKYGSIRLLMRPASGRGLAAGSSARAILGLAGVTDTSVKVLSRSKNKVNIARATMAALRQLSNTD